MNQLNRLGLSLMLCGIILLVAIIVLVASSRTDIDISVNEFLLGMIGGGLLFVVGSGFWIGRD